jgi:hypothetical protein
VETDEVYVGVDKRGIHYVFPVQAKGGKDQLGIVQIEQDFALCADRFPTLLCRALAAQFMEDDLIHSSSSSKVKTASDSSLKGIIVWCHQTK